MKTLPSSPRAHFALYDLCAGGEIYGLWATEDVRRHASGAQVRQLWRRDHRAPVPAELRSAGLLP